MRFVSNHELGIRESLRLKCAQCPESPTPAASGHRTTMHLAANMLGKPENEDSFLSNETNKNFNYLKINSLKNFENSKIKLKRKINCKFNKKSVRRYSATDRDMPKVPRIGTEKDNSTENFFR